MYGISASFLTGMMRSMEMAAIRSVGLVLLGCVVLLSHPGNGSRISSIQADKCGAAAGERLPCSKRVARSNWTQQLSSDYITDDGLAYYKIGYVTKHKKDGYYGFAATMDVYGLSLSPGQRGSFGLVWVETYDEAGDTAVDSIRIGWRVEPGSKLPLFHLDCTASGLTRSTNMDMNCHDFRPEIGSSTHPGDAIPGVSQPNGRKQYIALKLLKDNNSSGDWLVHYGFNKSPELIGRLPKSMFTSLAIKATDIWFGGMALTNVTFQPTPSLAPMGTGYTPVARGDGSNMAAFISNIELFDEQGVPWQPDEDLAPFATRPDPYSISGVAGGQFFYGGPLRSAAMPCSVHAVYCYFLLALLLTCCCRL